MKHARTAYAIAATALAGCGLIPTSTPPAEPSYNQLHSQFVRTIGPYRADLSRYVASDGTELVFSDNQRRELAQKTFLRVWHEDSGRVEPMAWPGYLSEERMMDISGLVSKHSTTHPKTGEAVIKYDRNDAGFEQAYSLCVKIAEVPCISERVKDADYKVAKTPAEKRILDDKKIVLASLDGNIIPIAEYLGAKIVGTANSSNKSDIYPGLNNEETRFVAAYFRGQDSQQGFARKGMTDEMRAKTRKFEGFTDPKELARQNQELETIMDEAGKRQNGKNTQLLAQLYFQDTPALRNPANASGQPKPDASLDNVVAQVDLAPKYGPNSALQGDQSPSNRSPQFYSQKAPGKGRGIVGVLNAEDEAKSAARQAPGIQAAQKGDTSAEKCYDDPIKEPGSCFPGIEDTPTWPNFIPQPPQTKPAPPTQYAQATEGPVRLEPGIKIGKGSSPEVGSSTPRTLVVPKGYSLSPPVPDNTRVIYQGQQAKKPEYTAPKQEQIAQPLIQPTQPSPIVEAPQAQAQAEAAQQPAPQLEQMVRDAVETKEILPIPQVAALPHQVMPHMGGRNPWEDETVKSKPLPVQPVIPQPTISVRPTAPASIPQPAPQPATQSPQTTEYKLSMPVMPHMGGRNTWELN